MGLHERLFIVDDDPQVAKFLRRRGESFGHKVVGEAKSRADVLDLLHSAEIDFSVAIVDGLYGQGEDVARMLKEANPRAHIIAHTSVGKPFGDVLVQKPDPGGTLWTTIATLKSGT